jgi:hypothetical protein
MSTDAQAEPIRKHLVEASIEFWHATWCFSTFCVLDSVCDAGGGADLGGS